MIIKKLRVHGVRVGLQDLRDEAGSGYILKNPLWDEVRRVTKPYGVGPAGHQNFMPRTSLDQTENLWIDKSLHENDLE